MDEFGMNQYPNRPQRRMRSNMQIIKEDYLPVIIIGIALILIIWFIIGSIVRSVQRKQYNNDLNLQASAAAQENQAALEAEAVALLAEAAELANQYDYNGAIAVLDQFSGDMYAFPNLSDKYAEYASAAASLVLWDDPAKVLNLSFHPLIADTDRAFVNTDFYYDNYITVDEFSKILSQLYANNYMLVRHSDIIGKDGKMELYLPKDKKPLIITETQVNYNTSLVDGDDDGIADKDGWGFASKLILDDNGNLTCEMVNSAGNTVTGAYDIVPILESFIQTHQDFSYRGARAVLALTGFDGLFGYRTTPKAKAQFGTVYYDQQVADAKKVIEAVKKCGYELACYSYDNEPYGNYSADKIKEDLELWKAEVTPLLGDLTLLVLCRNSDIADPGVSYSGDKYSVLKSYGFTNFIGFCTDGKPWFSAYADHTRMGRIMVTGNNLETHPAWFAGIFDTEIIKDKAR